MLHLFPIRDDAASKSFMFVGCLCCLFWEAVMLSNRTVLVIIAGLRMANAFRDHLVFCDEVHRIRVYLMQVTAAVLSLIEHGFCIITYID